MNKSTNPVLCVTGQSCQEEVGDVEPVSLESQAGVFIITWAICGSGLIVAVVQHLISSRFSQVQSYDTDASQRAKMAMTDGEMVREVFKKVSEQATLLEALHMKIAASSMESGHAGPTACVH